MEKEDRGERTERDIDHRSRGQSPEWRGEIASEGEDKPRGGRRYKRKIGILGIFGEEKG